MKKIIFLTAFLFSVILNAQNQPLISKMAETNNLDDLKIISENIVSGFPKKMKHYKTVASSGGGEEYRLVIFIPEEMNPTGKTLNPEEKEQAVVINFGMYNKGENKDLEIAHEPVYFFRNVSETYLNLVSFWIPTFNPNTTKEEVLNDYKLQEYRVNKDLKYKLKKQGDTWTLSRSY